MKKAITTESCQYQFNTDNYFVEEAKVYAGTDVISFKKVAIKIVKNPLEQFKNISSDHIVKILAFDSYKKVRPGKPAGSQKHVMVMEFCNGTTLFEAMKSNHQLHQGLKDQDFFLLLECLYSAMKELQDRHLVHGDITPHHIMIHSEDDGKKLYKLIGLHESDAMNDGSLKFLPYQLARMISGVDSHGDYEKNSERTDLHMIGTTLFYAATGFLPCQPIQEDILPYLEMWGKMVAMKSDALWISQEMKDGPFKMHHDLPSSCQMSRHLRTLLTPLLASLLNEKNYPVAKFLSDAEALLNSNRLKVYFPLRNIMETFYLKDITWNNLKLTLTAMEDSDGGRSFRAEDEMDFYMQGKHLTEDEPLNFHVRSCLALSTFDPDILTCFSVTSKDTSVLNMEDFVIELPIVNDNESVTYYYKMMQSFLKMSTVEYHFDLLDDLLITLIGRLKEQTGELIRSNEQYGNCVSIMTKMCQEGESIMWNKVLEDSHWMSQFVKQYESKLMTSEGHFAKMVETTRQAQDQRERNRHWQINQLYNKCIEVGSQTDLPAEALQQRCFRIACQARDKLQEILLDEMSQNKRVKGFLKEYSFIQTRLEEAMTRVQTKMESAEKLLNCSEKVESKPGDVLRCLSGLMDLITKGKDLEKEIKELEIVLSQQRGSS